MNAHRSNRAERIGSGDVGANHTAAGSPANGRVYGTHVTMADSHVGHINAIWPTEADARAHAQAQSTFPNVLRASVTEFTLGELGTRRPIVWYRHGQPDSNGRPFPTDGLQPVHDPKRPH